VNRLIVLRLIPEIGPISRQRDSSQLGIPGDDQSSCLQRLRLRFRGNWEKMV
jgi:hypothetical protein